VHIIAFVNAGDLMSFAGRVVAVPVIGHATSHAYRALIEW
jgi:uncharacterized membrane protein